MAGLRAACWDYSRAVRTAQSLVAAMAEMLA